MLGKGFRFSQTALATFYVCRRQFWLRYVLKVQWPAMLTDRMAGWENAIERGSLFHRWVHQDSVGMDLTDSVRGTGDPLLQRWWSNWCNTPPMLPKGVLYSEIQLSVPIQSHRLVAQFDRMIITEEGHLHIGDWKTGLREPEQSVYEASWQTRVYRFVAVEAGAIFSSNSAIAPSEVLLTYWHANSPTALQPILYSDSEHERIRLEIEQSIAEISELPNEIEAFPKCRDRAACSRCTYAVLCARGSASMDEWEEDVIHDREEIEEPW